MSDCMTAFRDAGIPPIDEFAETGRISIDSFVTDVLQQFAKIQAHNLLFGDDSTQMGGWPGGQCTGCDGMAITL